jgi:hypothetical protein
MEAKMIIAGYEGVGKTTFARLHPDDATDFTNERFKFELAKDADCSALSIYNERNLEWPLNYVDAIEKIKDDKKYTLIPADPLVLSLLSERGVTFLLVRPLRGAKEEYRRRFTESGKSYDYIETYADQWDGYIDSLERIGHCVQIVLDIDEYFSDVIEHFDQSAALLVFSGMEMMITSGALEVIKEDGFTRLEIKTDLFDQHNPKDKTDCDTPEEDKTNEEN